ncbi:MAG: hypothetical protein KDI43_08605 [Gammaproteobacteria bacterium]|nr:hypothetical protein [Gammaproteobacteria bacterium]
MAEINQPAPVKPVWPARREPHQKKRNPPDLQKKDGREKRREPYEPEGDNPGIDAYV